jgi:hypothetical protein
MLIINDAQCRRAGVASLDDHRLTSLASLLHLSQMQALYDGYTASSYLEVSIFGITMALPCTDDMLARGDEIRHPSSHREGVSLHTPERS